MIEWSCKAFKEISTEELYRILHLRSEVFVVEQNCVYQDCDDKDQQSYHLMGYEDDKLVAYSRLLPAGLSFESPSIGRVVTSPSARKAGYGRELMIKAIATIKTIFPGTTITIGAQLYLKVFYSSLGFKKVGDVYLEDGIKHITMICS